MQIDEKMMKKVSDKLAKEFASEDILYEVLADKFADNFRDRIIDKVFKEYSPMIEESFETELRRAMPKMIREYVRDEMENICLGSY